MFLAYSRRLKICMLHSAEKNINTNLITKK